MFLVNCFAFQHNQTFFVSSDKSWLEVCLIGGELKSSPSSELLHCLFSPRDELAVDSKQMEPQFLKIKSAKLPFDW